MAPSSLWSRARRRGWPLGVAAAVVAAFTLFGPSTTAQAADPPLDPHYDLNVYLLEDVGRLRCYTLVSGVNAGPKYFKGPYYVSSEFAKTKQIFISGDGLYRITDDGKLFWYNRKKNPRIEGSTCSALDPGRQVRADVNWGDFRRVYGGSNPGTPPSIYTLDWFNIVTWYRHLDSATGADDWDRTCQRPIINYSRFYGPEAITGGDHGVFYEVRGGGNLHWHRYDTNYHPCSGSAWNHWYPTTGANIGYGWDSFARIFSVGGYIFGVQPDGQLRWYEHQDFGGGSWSWHPASRTVIGTGWLAGFRDYAVAYPN